MSILQRNIMQGECGIQTSSINTCINCLVLLGNNKKSEEKHKVSVYFLLILGFSFCVLNIATQNPFYQMQVAITLLLF